MLRHICFTVEIVPDSFNPDYCGYRAQNICPHFAFLERDPNIRICRLFPKKEGLNDSDIYNGRLVGEERVLTTINGFSYRCQQCRRQFPNSEVPIRQ